MRFIFLTVTKTCSSLQLLQLIYMARYNRYATSTKLVWFTVIFQAKWNALFQNLIKLFLVFEFPGLSRFKFREFYERKTINESITFSWMVFHKNLESLGSNSLRIFTVFQYCVELITKSEYIVNISLFQH